MKIGSFDFPDRLKLSQAISVAKIIYEHSVSTHESLATRLSHKSANSGTYLMKLADLRRYGLIKSGHSGVSLTELGEKIAKPKTQFEKFEALDELFRRIPLFVELEKKLGGKQPDPDFWIHLQEVTGVERKTAADLAPKVKYIFLDALELLPKSNDKSSTADSSDENGQESFLEEPSSKNFISIKTEDSLVKIPMDLKIIRRIKKTLEIYEEELVNEEKE